MKSAIVSTKDWDLTECMSTARCVEYTEEDFKDIDIFSDSQFSIKKNDVSYMCRQILRCPVAKCNLKKGILEHRKTIMKNIQARKMDEARTLINTIEEQFNRIKTTTKGK